MNRHPVEVRRDPHTGRHYAYCPPCRWASPSCPTADDAAAAGQTHP